MRFYLVLGVVLISFSCSHHKSKEERLAQKKVAQSEIHSKLDELSLVAKSQGEESIKYLASDMYLKASWAQLKGDFETSNLIFEKLSELQPDDDFIKRKWAVGLIRTGEIEKSEKVLEAIFENSKFKDDKVGLILGGVYSSLGKSEKAYVLYNKLLKEDPKNEEICIFLSKTLNLEDKSEEAYDVLLKCEKNNPKNGSFAFYRGKLLAEKEDYEGAEREFKKAVTLQGDLSQAVMALGLVYEKRSSFKEAIKLYENYLVKDPSDSLVLSRLVQLLFNEEQFEKVIPYAERLSDEEPDNLNLKVKLGILYTDSGKYNDAISIFKELLTVAPNSDKILYYIGAIYQEMKNYPEAISYFSKIRNDSALYTDGQVQNANMYMALALHENKDKTGQSARKKFLKFVKNSSQKIKKLAVEFNVIKANYYEQVTEVKKAIKALEEVKDNENFGLNHHYYLASLYEKNKNYKDSDAVIKKILQNDPNNAHALNFIGYSMLERNDNIEEAYAYIKKAYELKPDDGYIRDSLGWYYYKTGQLDKAINELTQAYQAEPNDTSILKHLAIVYVKLNKIQKAKEFISKVLSVTKEESIRAELNEVLKSLNENRVPANFDQKLN
jgi:tetratricopeptide (TPR) repeat protein